MKPLRRCLAPLALLLSISTAHAQLAKTTLNVPVSGAPPSCVPATRLAALPQTFSMGVIMNGGLTSPGDGWFWAHNAGVNENIGWLYLNNGWQTQSGGTFISQVMSAAQTYGLVPTFEWYLAGSNPFQFQNSTFMNNNGSNTGYFQLFQLFLQQAIASGTGKFMIDMEPDSFGTAEQTVAPALTMSSFPARVASSGYTGVAGFASLPNTLAGLAQGLMMIRNTYAPNIPIGYHTAVWSSSNTHNFDAVLAPSAAAAFAGATDISTWIASSGTTWDLLYLDVSDSTSGYNKVVCSSSPTLRLWWGINNNGEVGPAGTNNFAAWTQWVGYLHTLTGLPNFVWQVPIGNTVMRAMDNNLNNNGFYACSGSCPAVGGNFQDDRVQYWAQSGNPHLSELVNVGSLGIMWAGGQYPGLGFCQPGGGNNKGDTQIGHWQTGRSTPYNPAPIGLSDSNAAGIYPGNATNDGVATTTDDDGGFLRTRLTAYFANPQPAVCPK